MSFLIYFIVITLVPILVHMYLKKTYSKHSKIGYSSGMTGYEVARKILDENGLSHVHVEETPGELSDHYDPTSRVVRLSTNNYYGNSIAGASVAAHEVGHAIQHQESYSFLTLRHRLVPVANFGSNASFFLILGGMLLSSSGLLLLGIVAMSLAVLFQVVTLPVEFNASNRAYKQMINLGIIRNNEESGVRKVLNAAALTYVAATIIAIIELLRFVLMFTGTLQNDEE